MLSYETEKFKTQACITTTTSRAEPEQLNATADLDPEPKEALTGRAPSAITSFMEKELSTEFLPQQLILYSKRLSSYKL